MRSILLIGLLLLSAVALAKGLTARVDRNQLGLGEQVELTVVLTDIRGRAPNTAGLLKDFSIDRQSQSSNVQILNGVVNQQARWVFLLSPNRKGKLTIPALKVDRFSSDPIEVTVTEMPVAQSTSDDVLLEVELSPKIPYIQSQVAYIQRLYFSRPLVDSASISTPKLSQGDADIQFWGSSDPRYVTHNNRPYQLIERYYIIYPRKAGVLVFEPSVFNGSLASSRRRNDYQRNLYRTGTRVNAYSGKASIEIKPKPDSYIFENWLPATSLTLSRSFSQPVETLKAGEPVTVTLGIMAEGLKAEVLPEVALDLPEGIKSYPEKPAFQTDKVRNGMVGLRQEKVVLIANKAGEYNLPEVKIPWWSVTEDKLKFATIKAEVLKVSAGVMSSVPQSGAAPQGAEIEVAESKPNEETNEAEEDESSLSEASPLLTGYRSSLLKFYDQYKQALGIGLFLVTGFMLFAWVFWSRRRVRLNSSEYQQQMTKDAAASQLKAACKQNDLKSALAALPLWAKTVGIYPSTMAGIEASGSFELSSAIRAINEASYSPNPTAWDGELLLVAANKYVAEKQVSANLAEGLTPLHPIAS